MENILMRLFKAADNHGNDTGEPDHTVGDLQQLLVRACSFLSDSQKVEFLQSSEVQELVEAGARDEFDAASLIAQVHPTSR